MRRAGAPRRIALGAPDLPAEAPLASLCFSCNIETAGAIRPANCKRRRHHERRTSDECVAHHQGVSIEGATFQSLRLDPQWRSKCMAGHRGRAPAARCRSPRWRRRSCCRPRCRHLQPCTAGASLMPSPRNPTACPRVSACDRSLPVVDGLGTRVWTQNRARISRLQAAVVPVRVYIRIPDRMSGRL